MENRLVTVEHRAVLLLLCVLLGTGTSSATETGEGAGPPKTSGNQATTPPSSGTPSQHPTNWTPLLVRNPKQPPTGTYDIIDRNGSECLKAQMGVQYKVTENKNTLYFNIDPSSTRGTGQCGPKTSNLTLNFPGGRLDFTFREEEKMSYVTTVRASLETSVCKDCKRELFEGVITEAMLFKVSAGRCYKCDAWTTLQFAENLSVKITNAKIQASGITGSKFGTEEECWTDFNRRVIPIVLGGAAVGICLIAVLTYLIIRDNSAQGYERL
ncbi:lysosome-associated membrane glycoprotein 3 [Anguilla anguilla]|uniref:lysosome-associated membrane glycoprotein 3 n=1 Tax=Anguilla anguilla TaxID=7936 RepID=UPI0015B18964|nr:lysosome-associated membrane glycoprotein 3 [Anguilla anguilla]